MKSESKRDLFRSLDTDEKQAGGIYDDLLKNPAPEQRCFNRLWLAMQQGDVPRLEDIDALQTWLNAVRAKAETGSA